MRSRRPSRHRFLVRSLGSVFLPLLFVSPAARALEGGTYRVEILVDGRPIAEYAARGRTYVEALEGREYSIRLANHTGERIAVALSVDGLNTIDARTTSAVEASKWILGPYETLTLDGWQTGPRTARRFFFTTEDRSYGAWLGKVENLGLVSAAVFRERRPYPVPVWRRDAPGAESGAEERAREPRPDALGESGQRSRSAAKAEAAPSLSDELAATGIGREVGHRVRRVPFVAESDPAAVLELRYEFRDALVRLGVLPRHRARAENPLDRRERARGFEGLEFAPDPYRSR